MQTQLRPNSDTETLKTEWADSVNLLAEQLTKWANSRHWAIEAKQRVVHEEGLGAYSATDLIFQTPQGTLYLEAKPRGSSQRLDASSYTHIHRA